ncbi:MAG: hypothetical protein P4M06_19325, partial [Pandoraea sp.]
NALSQQIAEKKPTGNADVDQALGNIVSNTLATTLGAATGGFTGAPAIRDCVGDWIVGPMRAHLHQNYAKQPEKSC